MPRFEPFRGLRYNLDRVSLDDVTAPPYDVIDSDQRSALLARHPDNVVQVDLPVDDGRGDPYERAAEQLAAWLREGIVVHDPEPSFYVYRMNHVDEAAVHRHTTGVIGALTLRPPGEADTASGEQPILPHEHTTPKAKSDRLQLTRATRTNLSAVWGLSPAAGLSELFDTHEPPLAAWTDGDGVGHELWQITDASRVREIADTVSSQPIVIADGHHRYETALNYQRERREAGDGDGPWDAAMFFVVELAEDELSVLPIHRLISGLPDGFDLADAFEEFFEVSPAGAVDHTIADRMQAEGALTLVTSDGAWFLRPRPETVAAARDLDTSRLDVALAGLPDHELVFQHGVDEVVACVGKGEAQAGVLLRPASIAQIVEIAHGGERMPPKTTFFHPKPKTGVVIRSLQP